MLGGGEAWALRVGKEAAVVSGPLCIDEEARWREGKGAGPWWGGWSAAMGEDGGIFNYLPLLEMALHEMGLLGLVLRFCHRLLSGATHLGLLVTWQATSPIQRGIGRGNDPRALPFPLLSRGGRSSGSSRPLSPPSMEP
jgi:hypothetical protein